jgi:four helix bundle protein
LIAIKFLVIHRNTPFCFWTSSPFSRAEGLDVQKQKGAKVLNHQKLDCYQKGIRLVKEVQALMPNWPGRAPLKDQAERAAISAILNLAEGAGKLTPKDRRKYFAISRGSIQEFSACIDIAHALGLVSQSEYNHFQNELLSMVKMVSRLITVQGQFQSSSQSSALS